MVDEHECYGQKEKCVICTTRMEWTNSKYLFERKPFKRWFVFGYDNKGLVDISDGDDILTKVPKETAFKLIELRNQFISQVENLIYKPEDKDHE